MAATTAPAESARERRSSKGAAARRAWARARWNGDPGSPYAGGADEHHGRLPPRGGGAVEGEVLEDLLKRSEAALEVGHPGIGDAEEAVLADRVLEELGDVGGELADRLALVVPGGDGEAGCAGAPAGGDHARGVDVLGFVSPVDRAAFEVIDGGVQLIVWTSREIGAQVAGLHDPQASARGHQEPGFAERLRGVSGEPVGGCVSGRRGPTHDAGDVPSAGDGGRDEGAHGLVDALVVNDLGDGFLDIGGRDAGGLDVRGDAGVEALHRGVRQVARHQLVDRVEPVAGRGVQPAAAQQRGDVLAGHR